MPVANVRRDGTGNPDPLEDVASSAISQAAGCGLAQGRKGCEVVRPRMPAIDPGQGQTAPHIRPRHRRLVARGIGMVGHGHNTRQVTNHGREPADLELPLGQPAAVSADRPIDGQGRAGEPAAGGPGVGPQAAVEDPGVVAVA